MFLWFVIYCSFWHIYFYSHDVCCLVLSSPVELQVLKLECGLVLREGDAKGQTLPSRWLPTSIQSRQATRRYRRHFGMKRLLLVMLTYQTDWRATDSSMNSLKV